MLEVREINNDKNPLVKKMKKRTRYFLLLDRFKFAYYMYMYLLLASENMLPCLLFSRFVLGQCLFSHK